MERGKRGENSKPEGVTLISMSTESPPVEAPRMVLTMARATIPPSPGWEMLAWRMEISKEKNK